MWRLQSEFDSGDDLTVHLQSCGAANAILLPVTAVMLNGSLDERHKVSHLIWAIPESRSYITDYAKAIANEMGSFDRSIIHKRVCSKLGIDYQSFRPFEADDIDSVPTVNEAEMIIYKALGAMMREELFGEKK